MLAVVLNPISGFFEIVLECLQGDFTCKCRQFSDLVKIVPNQHNHLMDIVEKTVQFKLNAGRTMDFQQGVFKRLALIGDAICLPPYSELFFAILVLYLPEILVCPAFPAIFYSTSHEMISQL